MLPIYGEYVIETPLVLFQHDTSIPVDKLLEEVCIRLLQNQMMKYRGEEVDTAEAAEAAADAAAEATAAPVFSDYSPKGPVVETACPQKGLS